MYRTVTDEFTEDEVKNFDYDMLVFFSPTGIQALINSMPEWKQGDVKIACFGPATVKEAQARGLRVDVVAPSKEYPSMASALKAFVAKENQKK